MEQVILHDAHVEQWVLKHGMKRGWSWPVFVPLPAVWQPEGQDQSRIHEIKQQPNIQFKDIENFFTGFWEHYNNPHNVTAEQVGLYCVDESHRFKDDDVIDVEARVVEEPKQLAAPKREQDE